MNINDGKLPCRHTVKKECFRNKIHSRIKCPHAFYIWICNDFFFKSLRIICYLNPVAWSTKVFSYEGQKIKFLVPIAQASAYLIVGINIVGDFIGIQINLD